MPKKFNEGKVSLKVVDKTGVLRLDKFMKIMLDRRGSLQYKDVQIIGQRKKPSRSDYPGIRGDTYGLKYLFSQSQSLRLTNIEFKSCYPDARVVVECNLSNLIIENSLICEPVQFLNPDLCKLKKARITDSDLEILDYSAFSNIETMELAGNNTWMVEKVRSNKVKELYIKPEHT